MLEELGVDTFVVRWIPEDLESAISTWKEPHAFLELLLAIGFPPSDLAEPLEAFRGTPVWSIVDRELGRRPQPTSVRNALVLALRAAPLHEAFMETYRNMYPTEEVADHLVSALTSRS